MKQCPYKRTAVQAQAARLVDKGASDENALKMARDQFGTCDEEGCACWLWYGHPKAGSCGLSKSSE